MFFHATPHTGNCLLLAPHCWPGECTACVEARSVWRNLVWGAPMNHQVSLTSLKQLVPSLPGSCWNVRYIICICNASITKRLIPAATCYSINSAYCISFGGLLAMDPAAREIFFKRMFALKIPKVPWHLEINGYNASSKHPKNQELSPPFFSKIMGVSLKHYYNNICPSYMLYTYVTYMTFDLFMKHTLYNSSIMKISIYDLKIWSTCWMHAFVEISLLFPYCIQGHHSVDPFDLLDGRWGARHKRDWGDRILCGGGKDSPAGSLCRLRIHSFWHGVWGQTIKEKGETQ